MNKETDALRNKVLSDQVVLGLSRSNRVEAAVRLGITGVLILILATGAMRRLLSSIEGISRNTGEIIIWSAIVALLCSIMVFILGVVILALKTGWYAVQFIVSEKGIIKKLPNGREISKRWDEIEYVSGKPLSIFFNDGTCIILSYGPHKRIGGLSGDALRTIALMSGASPVAHSAFGDMVAAFQPSRKNTARTFALYFYLVVCTLVSVIIVREFGRTSPWFLLSAFCTFLGALAIRILILDRDRRLADRKYSPPRNKSVWRRI